MVHATIVDIDFKACFENYVASINGARPYRMVSEMSFRALVFAVKDRLSDELIVGALGLLPLLPFSIAWFASRTARWRTLWIICALVSLAIIIVGYYRSGLAGFYDCDRNGISLGILLVPLVFTIINFVTVLGILVTSFMMRMATRI
jgi:hypothetical protein